MTTADCAECRALKARAQYLQQFDWRDGREAWQAYWNHVRDCHPHEEKAESEKEQAR